MGFPPQNLANDLQKMMIFIGVMALIIGLVVGYFGLKGVMIVIFMFLLFAIYRYFRLKMSP